jgi:hypothetical protein
MGFKKVVQIRHIRGDTFEVELEADADGLGLKLLVFEVRGTPIERQRLVYAGHEIAEGDVLSSLGIDAGSTIFLVETEPVAAIPQVSGEDPVAPVPVPVTREQPSVQTVVDVEGDAYQPLDEVSVPKGDQILRLNKFVRRYCWFGLVASLLFGWSCGLGNLLHILFFAMGLHATKKLKTCTLCGPITMTLLLFIGLGAASIGLMFWSFSGWELGIMFLALLHGVIAACILKYYILLKALTPTETEALRVRLNASKKCCFNCCW